MLAYISFATCVISSFYSFMVSLMRLSLFFYYILVPVMLCLEFLSDLACFLSHTHYPCVWVFIFSLPQIFLDVFQDIYKFLPFLVGVFWLLQLCRPLLCLLWCRIILYGAYPLSLLRPLRVAHAFQLCCIYQFQGILCCRFNWRWLFLYYMGGGRVLLLQRLFK